MKLMAATIYRLVWALKHGQDILEPMEWNGRKKMNNVSNARDENEYENILSIKWTYNVVSATEKKSTSFMTDLIYSVD